MALPADAALFGCTCYDVFDTAESLEKHVQEQHHQKWLLACRPCYKSCPKNPVWFFPNDLPVLLRHFREKHRKLLVAEEAPDSTFGESQQIRTAPAVQDRSKAFGAVMLPPPASDIAEERRDHIRYQFPITRFSGTKKCPNCNQTFQKLSAAKRHYDMTRHGRSRQCLTCLRFFLTERDLVQHERSGTHGDMSRFRKAAVVNPTPAAASHAKSKSAMVSNPTPQSTVVSNANSMPTAPLNAKPLQLAPSHVSLTHCTPSAKDSLIIPEQSASTPLGSDPALKLNINNHQERIDLDAVFLQIQEEISKKMGTTKTRFLTLGNEIEPNILPTEPDERVTPPPPKRRKTEKSPFAAPVKKLETVLYYCNTCQSRFESMADLNKHLVMGKGLHGQLSRLPERLSLSPAVRR